MHLLIIRKLTYAATILDFVDKDYIKTNSTAYIQFHMRWHRENKTYYFIGSVLQVWPSKQYGL